MARIAFLVDDLRIGGSELFLRDIVLSLREDQDVQVLGLFGGGPVEEELAREGVPVRILGLRKWNAPWKLLELVTILNDESIRVLHCERMHSSIIGVLAGRLAEVERVFVRRGSLPWWPGRLHRSLDRLTMKWSDGILAASEAIRDGFVEEQGLPPEMFHVIPHGLSGPLGPPPQLGGGDGGHEGEPVLGCVANFNWRKDHETLIQAYRAVVEEIPGARLQLVGSGPLESSLREKVAACGLEDRVEFLGHRGDVPDLLRQFDLLVLPSLTEGFGRVLLEAMAAGVPVVATMVGGIPEVVTNDLTGILVRPESPEAMAGAILHLLGNPTEARRLATNARRDVADRFALESVVRAYREVVGLGPPPPPEEESEDQPLEAIPCPLCGGSGQNPVALRPDGMEVVRCPGCTLLFVSPRPLPEALASLYTQEYFAGEGEYGWMSGYLDGEMAELDHPGGYWAGLLGRLERLLGRKGKVLDVGCSGGFFLERAKREGWEGHGVEVSEAMVSFAREKFGNEAIRLGTLEEARFDPDAFDAVLMHNLIEHVADPLGTLKEARRVLKPGGWVCLTTPNARAVEIQGSGWKGFHAHFGHVTFFTRATLRRLLLEAGLKPGRWEHQYQNVSCPATRGLGALLASPETPGGIRKVLSAARAVWQKANGGLFYLVSLLGYSRNLLVLAQKETTSPTSPTTGK